MLRLARPRLGHAAGPRADDTDEREAEFVRLDAVAVSAYFSVQLCAAGVVTWKSMIALDEMESKRLERIKVKF